MGSATTAIRPGQDEDGGLIAILSMKVTALSLSVSGTFPDAGKEQWVYSGFIVSSDFSDLRSQQSCDLL
jgi:hypothetical protein